MSSKVMLLMVVCCSDRSYECHEQLMKQGTSVHTDNMCKAVPMLIIALCLITAGKLWTTCCEFALVQQNKRDP